MAADFKITFNKKAEKQMLAIGERAVMVLAQEAKGIAIRKSPYKTGTNRRSIDFALRREFMRLLQPPVSVPRGAVAAIFTQSGYGAHLEFGTGVHGHTGKPIVPKKAKVLHWVDEEGEHFARSVQGMEARPYMRPALESVKARAGAILRKEFKT